MVPTDAIAELECRGLTGWRAAQGRPAIARSYRFADFDAAFAWMSKIAIVAAAADHHPEWSNVYNRVEVVLTTHSAGGVTEKDLALAAAMDAAVVRPSTD
jgi:4a-hydroxytetrahydrobiopterin dehydratase